MLFRIGLWVQKCIGIISIQILKHCAKRLRQLTAWRTGENRPSHQLPIQARRQNCWGSHWHSRVIAMRRPGVHSSGYDHSPCSPSQACYRAGIHKRKSRTEGSGWLDSDPKGQYLHMLWICSVSERPWFLSQARKGVLFLLRPSTFTWDWYFFRICRFRMAVGEFFHWLSVFSSSSTAFCSSLRCRILLW